MSIWRWAFAALLIAHGVAHMAGFAVSWRLLSSPDLPYHTTLLNGRLEVGSSGMQIVGLAWLLVGLAVAASAASLIARWDYAFTAIVAATAGSLILCVLEWPLAWLGIAANVAVLLLVPLIAANSWRHDTDGAVAALLHTGELPTDVHRISALPAPVQRYFSRTLGHHSRRIRSAVLIQQAEFHLDNAWKPLSATEYFTAHRPGFVWDAKITTLPGMPFYVRDAYVAGRGAMQASVAGVLPMVEQAGAPELNSGALHRFLAEAVWIPTALLPSDAVHWEAIDQRSARVTMTDTTSTVSLDFTFNSNGDVVEIFTASRFAEHDGHYVRQPWLVRCADHRIVSGVRIPTWCEVSWQPPSGARPYWRGRVISARYGYEESRSARANHLASMVPSRVR